MNRATIERIITESAASFATDSETIRGRDRHQNVRMARRAVVYVARTEGYSLIEIGVALGRDHTTIAAIETMACVDFIEGGRFAPTIKEITARMRKPQESAKNAHKHRKGGVYYVRRNGDETWEGTWNGWGDMPDDHGRLEWTDREEAFEACAALRALERLEGRKGRIVVVWSRRSFNRDLPHHSAVNKVGRERQRSAEAPKVAG